MHKNMFVLHDVKELFSDPGSMFTTTYMAKTRWFILVHVLHSLQQTPGIANAVLVQKQRQSQSAAASDFSDCSCINQAVVKPKSLVSQLVDRNLRWFTCQE